MKYSRAQRRIFPEFKKSTLRGVSCEYEITPTAGPRGAVKHRFRKKSAETTLSSSSAAEIVLHSRGTRRN